jgi:transaldolase
MLLLDSARADDARRAAALGFVRGATTNPALMAVTGRRAEDVIPQLADILPGTVFHQLTGETPDEREAEAHRFAALRPGRIGIKVPCTTENLGLVARLAADGLTCAVTAIFSPAQAVLAVEAGSGYLIPYVNRTTRLLGDGPALVRELRQVIDALGAPTRIIAASVKSDQEAVAALVAGAHWLTLPLPVLETLGEHPASLAAIEEFRAATQARLQEAT